MDSRDFALEKMGPKIGAAIKRLGYEVAFFTFDLDNEYAGDVPSVKAA
jgi:hypothetical protein